MTPYYKTGSVAAAVATALMTNSAWAQEKPEATNLDEVVVTAQKVSQSVIDVPLSISVLGADDLERTQSAEHPGLREARAGSAAHAGAARLRTPGVKRHQHGWRRIDRRRVRR